MGGGAGHKQEADISGQTKPQELDNTAALWETGSGHNVEMCGTDEGKEAFIIYMSLPPLTL